MMAGISAKLTMQLVVSEKNTVAAFNKIFVVAFFFTSAPFTSSKLYFRSTLYFVFTVRFSLFSWNYNLHFTHCIFSLLINKITNKLACFIMYLYYSSLYVILFLIIKIQCIKVVGYNSTQIFLTCQ